MTQDDRQTIRGRYDEVAHRIAVEGWETFIDEPDELRIAAILRESFPESAPPQDARELAHEYAAKIISWTGGNTLRTSEIADQLQDYAARLAERAPRCGYDMGGECAVDKDERAPSPSADGREGVSNRTDGLGDVIARGEAFSKSALDRPERAPTPSGEAIRELADELYYQAHHTPRSSYLVAAQAQITALLSSPPSMQEIVVVQGGTCGCTSCPLYPKPAATPPSTGAKPIDDEADWS
jgi:hypothetical protein